MMPVGTPRWLALVKAMRFATALSLIGGACCASAQDPFVFYFDGTTAGAGTPGGATFDSTGAFWVAGRNSLDSLNKVTLSGGAWSGEEIVPNLDWKFFYRSDNVPAGTTHPEWGGPTFGTPASLLLNPAPLTITIRNGAGAMVSKTYQAGQLAFLTDAQGTIGPSGGASREDVTKRLYRFDLRTIDAPTTAQPDYNTASNGSTVFGAFGNADWNDVFTQVISEADLQTASGGLVGGSDNFGRRFAWSSDGQSIYAVDGSVNYGGIYKIDARTSGSLVNLRTDRTAISNGPDRINSEPAVVPTSVFDFNPTDPATGDQIIVEGSNDGGNNGGVNVYLDKGPGLTLPRTLFTEAQFRAFSEYDTGSFPEYPSLVADGAGNLYFYEDKTDGVYRYDTQGRFVKIASEAEHGEFQRLLTGAVGSDIVSDLQVRTSNAAGFPLTELVYVDDRLQAPAGMLVYKVGDFDRDNDVDQADRSLFAAALGTRGQAADVAEWKFDLNGNPVRDSAGSPVTNGASVVDWKDVKVLQQFITLPNGDVNFDALLNFSDLDIFSANYYTLPGQTVETWATGDIASIDPLYAVNAPDANRVNLVDLQVMADAWVNALGQAPVTMSQAVGRGYTGQFLTDLLSAFSSAVGLTGDYNNNGVVDAADYTVWRDSLGATGSGLPADGDNNMVVNSADLVVWRNNFGQTAALGGGGALGAAVPEPPAWVAAMLVVSMLGASRLVCDVRSGS